MSKIWIIFGNVAPHFLKWHFDLHIATRRSTFALVSTTLLHRQWKKLFFLFNIINSRTFSPQNLKVKKKWKNEMMKTIKSSSKDIRMDSIAVACLKLLLLFIVAWITLQCCPNVIRASTSAASIVSAAPTADNAQQSSGRIVKTKYGNLRGFTLPHQQQPGNFVHVSLDDGLF